MQLTFESVSFDENSGSVVTAVDDISGFVVWWLDEADDSGSVVDVDSGSIANTFDEDEGFADAEDWTDALDDTKAWSFNWNY